MSEVDDILGFAEPEDDLDRDAFEVIGAAINVRKALGPGHAEAVYESALAVELEHLGIPFERQHPYDASYRGRVVGAGRIDLIVRGRLIVEIKSVAELSPIHTAQVIGYLRATGLMLALLINFNVVRLKDGGVKRVAYGKQLRRP